MQLPSFCNIEVTLMEGNSGLWTVIRSRCYSRFLAVAFNAYKIGRCPNFAVAVTCLNYIKVTLVIKCRTAWKCESASYLLDLVTRREQYICCICFPERVDGYLSASFR